MLYLTMQCPGMKSDLIEHVTYTFYLFLLMVPCSRQVLNTHLWTASNLYGETMIILHFGNVIDHNPII